MLEQITNFVRNNSLALIVCVSCVSAIAMISYSEISINIKDIIEIIARRS